MQRRPFPSFVPKIPFWSCYSYQMEIVRLTRNPSLPFGCAATVELSNGRSPPKTLPIRLRTKAARSDTAGIHHVAALGGSKRSLRRGKPRANRLPHTRRRRLRRHRGRTVAGQRDPHGAQLTLWKHQHPGIDAGQQWAGQLGLGEYKITTWAPVTGSATCSPATPAGSRRWRSASWTAARWWSAGPLIARCGCATWAPVTGSATRSPATPAGLRRWPSASGRAPGGGQRDR